MIAAFESRLRHGSSALQRSRVLELHYITPIVNLASIANVGLVCHQEAERIPHLSVASESVQDNRRDKRIPGGGILHSYVNTYFDARNSMMYKLLQDGVRQLAVLRISPDILDTSGAVISDGNAATGTTRFYPSPQGLSELDEQLVFADSWNHSDPWIKLERKRARSAEVLIPGFVLPRFIHGCYTLIESDAAACLGVDPSWKVEVNKSVYFR
ncbi:DUF4433 domain-containing protein [Streptomyces canus]|uniref:DUF4433 domain-containing protein n=1 Tax=Streptomyces canus TaxID=58343 RepID=UPI0030E26D3E